MSMSQVEMEAIATKHVHQCLEGMVRMDTAERNCVEELTSRLVQNWVRAIIREYMDEDEARSNEPHPPH